MTNALARLGEPRHLVHHHRHEHEERKGERPDGGKLDARAGTARATTSAPVSRCVLSDRTSRQRNPTWPRRYRAEAADQRGGRDGRERVVHVLERLLQAERGEHDPRDHREVEQRVGVARRARSARARRRAARAGARRARRSRRSRATRARRRSRSRAPRRRRRRRRRPRSSPTPIATIDSPRAMITISPCRSAKWAGTSCQPSDQNRSGAPTSSTSARAQIAPWSQPVRGRAQHEQRDAGRRARREPRDGPPQLRLVPARDHEEPDVRDRTMP